MPSEYRNGTGYDRISAPMERIGRDVLARLELSGDETVLDAGCGSGRVTQALLERLPRGSVIGIDGSPQMIQAARARLGDRAELLVADLERLDLGARRVDAVLSTAVLHWTSDHARVFSGLRSAMRDGAQLVAQCGGEGNTAELVAACETAAGEHPFDEHLGGWVGPWNFPAAGETEAHLHAAGFAEVRTWLIELPPPYEELREWLALNALSAHLARLPQELRAPYVDRVVEILGPDPRITYVRLNIDARAA